MNPHTLSLSFSFRDGWWSDRVYIPLFNSVSPPVRICQWTHIIYRLEFVAPRIKSLWPWNHYPWQQLAARQSIKPRNQIEYLLLTLAAKSSSKEDAVHWQPQAIDGGNKFTISHPQSNPQSSSTELDRQIFGRPATCALEQSSSSSSPRL